MIRRVGKRPEGAFRPSVRVSVCVCVCVFHSGLNMPGSTEAQYRDTVEYTLSTPVYTRMDARTDRHTHCQRPYYICTYTLLQFCTVASCPKCDWIRNPIIEQSNGKKISRYSTQASISALHPRVIFDPGCSCRVEELSLQPLLHCFLQWQAVEARPQLRILYFEASQ